MRLIWKLPLTWWTENVPVSIIQASFLNGTALHIIVNMPVHRQSIAQRAVDWSRGQLDGGTSKDLESVSVVDSSGKIYLQVRRGRAVNARAADASASAMDGRKVFLRRVLPPFGPAL